MCRNFANTELIPIAGDLDKHHKYPTAQISKLGELGMLGINVDQKWGGSGMDAMSYAIGMEEISRGCASTGVIMSANNSLYCSPVENYATDAQREIFLKPAASGAKIGCFMLTEPGNGSDAGAASTTAVDIGDYFLVNGSKAWITNAHDATYGVLFATTDKSLKNKGMVSVLVKKKTNLVFAPRLLGLLHLKMLRFQKRICSDPSAQDSKSQ